MPKRIAVVNYRVCLPEKCEDGVCLAVQACPKRLLKQEGRYEMPDPVSNMCLGCGICIQACPLEAIQLI